MSTSADVSNSERLGLRRSNSANSIAQFLDELVHMSFDVMHGVDGVVLGCHRGL